MKHRCLALMLIVSMAAAGCSATTSTPTTVGVDDAPQVIKNTFLVVARQAATLAGYDATSDQFLDFARELCGAGLESQQDLEEFVEDWAGPTANEAVMQVWSTSAGAATSSFCPFP